MTTLTVGELDQRLEKFRTTPQCDELKKLAKEGQHPTAIIVACADSRVAPEILFGTSVGELFVIRVAGNVIGPAEMASIEYAALALNVRACYVIGHSGCGAVAATIDWHVHHKKPPTPALVQLVEDIEPAVAEVTARKVGLPSEKLIDESTKTHLKSMVKSLHSNPNLQPKIKDGSFDVKACLFDMKETKLNWLEG